MIITADEVTGGSIRLSLGIGAPATVGGPPTMVPINEKLTADFNATVNPIDVEAAYDSDGWTRQLQGTRNVQIPVTMHLRKASLVYKAIRDAAMVEDGSVPIPYEYETPNEIFSGTGQLFGFNLTGTGFSAVAQVACTFSANGKPLTVDKP